MPDETPPAGGPEPADRLLERLRSPEGAAALVRLGFDFLLEQPLARFLEPDRVLAELDRLASSPRLQQALAEHLGPALDRALARAEATGEPLGGYLPGEARALAERLLARPVVLSRGFLEAVLEKPALRRMLRVVVVESVHRFVASLGQRGDGLLGRLGLGQGLLGKLGGKIEGSLQAAASAFVQGSLDAVLKGLVPALAGPEMAAELGTLRLEAWRAALELSEAELWRAVLAQPVDEILAVAPGVLRHNAARAEVRAAVRAEVQAFLRLEGRRSLRQVVGDPALVQAWGEETARLGAPLLQEFSGSSAFLAWLRAT
jgi:hypothetical protein